MHQGAPSHAGVRGGTLVARADMAHGVTRAAVGVLQNFRASGRRLDALVCNAAIYRPTAKEPEFTADGYETRSAAPATGAGPPGLLPCWGASNGHCAPCAQPGADGVVAMRCCRTQWRGFGWCARGCWRGWRW